MDCWAENEYYKTHIHTSTNNVNLCDRQCRYYYDEGMSVFMTDSSKFLF